MIYNLINNVLLRLPVNFHNRKGSPSSRKEVEENVIRVIRLAQTRFSYLDIIIIS